MGIFYKGLRMTQKSMDNERKKEKIGLILSRVRSSADAIE